MLKSSNTAAIRAKAKPWVTTLPRWPAGLTHADGARPAQLMAEQVHRRTFRGGVTHAHGGNGQGIALGAHRAAHLIIIGQVIGESGETADFVQRLAA